MKIDFDNTSILVVEDSQTLRSIFRRMLIGIGFSHVIEAKNGVDALSIFVSHVPDLIITDINMEPMDGISFVSKMRSIEKYKNIPVIMVSTDATQKNIEKAIELGVKGFISKPFSQNKLQENIHAAIAPKSDNSGNVNKQNKEKILIVDDSNVILSVVEKILLRIGFTEIYKSNSGSAAWTNILKNKPSVVITDVYMKNGSGIDLLKKIRESRDSRISSMKIILMSSDPSISEFDEVRFFKPSYVLEKPYKAIDLRNCFLNIGVLKT